VALVGESVAAAGATVDRFATGEVRLSLPVHDVPRSVAFYVEALGFRRVPRPVGAPSALVRLGPLYLELHPSGAARVPPVGIGRLDLRVRDLDTAVQGLRARGIPVGAIEPEPAGRGARFTDPDGHALRLWEPSEELGADDLDRDEHSRWYEEGGH
jgi:catechol 2,3-dioxygenase-like lactoylglutathione lyase family enzyme